MLLTAGAAEAFVLPACALARTRRLRPPPYSPGRRRPCARPGTDLDALEQTLDEFEVTNVVHLAALQVPFCRADPILGARVNIVGTANVLEAVRRRKDRIAGVAYASSAAVYGPGDRGSEDERPRPDTLYGVYKLANEGSARLYWTDYSVPTVGLRPFTVYGPGRDQGMTSAPTQAMVAAVEGASFHIPFAGRTQFHYVADVARAFITTSRRLREQVFNIPGGEAAMSELVASIEAVVPGSVDRITYADEPLPFPPSLESGALARSFGRADITPLVEGVRLTIEHLRRTKSRTDNLLGAS